MQRQLTTVWVARLPLAAAVAAAGLRIERHVEVATDADWLWLRGRAADAELVMRLRRVPGLQRFHCIDGSLLVRDGMSVPELRLPELSWQPILQFFPVALPSAGLPGLLPEPCGVKLVGSAVERPAAGLLLPFPEFACWVESAPQARLRPLAMCRAADDRCFVRGVPLPPRPGLAFYFEDRLAIPCGCRCAPAVPAKVLAAVLGRQVDDDGEGVFLLLEDSTWEWLPAGSFVAASRAAVRATRRLTAADRESG